ncbi:MAG: hypothetical protein KDA45_16445, partial [Planctomycetales bacterium]|nr:hypothetical protein [Planctomycetales bacterium]
MKYPPRKGFAYAVALLSVAACATPVEAQTDRALQRRVDRNERQLQRQLNRGDYYSPQTWQQLDPWIRDAGVVPFASTTAPARNAANAVGNAVRQTVDAATRIGDGQFGFRDKDPR